MLCFPDDGNFLNWSSLTARTGTLDLAEAGAAQQALPGV